MTKIIGLTGGIATGKTTVSTILRQAGIPVIDADQVARRVQMPASVGLARIVKTFGSRVLLPNGELNRPALARIVFNDQQARQKLNDILQPLIWDEIFARVTALKKQKIPVIVLDVPLLFEQHYDKECDQVIVVYTSPQIQLRRLMTRDHSSEKAAQARIAAQMSLSEKVMRADYVINNNSDQVALQKQVASLINQLKNK
ncbi:dephospho-CoA kinase [Limosilactobacillus sp. STM2_1]|uniref:Dephospho-CoA kinase n=1 Tax=Limosilactobacillus rudii TaxID=2759755 RepID=A0A7W3YMM4_9LACO|nr:dephospho-CoA kinase [Limosilactobacillus rudii]MBB1080090.1 dephospho-CoA kinase [Limosilactobacillus rudii]MBB1096422.1 dephospho-CoA kinase [Limosilactobacillus rudii]MCD7133577.1 dephospho-CoA kinase [Limosilactobacillus rudii]